MRDMPSFLGLRSACLGMALGWLGCTGTIGAEPSSNKTNPGGSPTASKDGELSWPVVYDGASSPLRRLSRDEIINTIQAVVGVAPSREDLPLERRASTHAVFTTVGASLIAAEVDKLANALNEVAAQAAAGVLMRSQCRATGTTQRDCLAAYAERLAAQAFRRALSATESMRLKALFANAGVSPSDDKLAMEMMIFTTFFSPSFLYRLETSPDGEPMLKPEAIAERLAYLATGEPADDELLSAARSGRLQNAKERAAQFDRLSRTPSGLKALAAFVLDHVGATESHVGNKSVRYRTNLPENYASDARASAVSAITTGLGTGSAGNFAQLLTTTSYLRDPAVETIVKDVGTGTVATGDGSDAQRMGLLMHPYVLSGSTKENGSSPFPLGMFIRQSLLCENIPAPPAGAVEMTPDEVPAGLSQRKQLEHRTNAAPVCTSCHATFSPLGYSFMPFDPVGRWTKQDPSGQPWDLSGEVDLYSGESLAFRSPNELVQRLAESPQAHGCFAQSAFIWALGRRPMKGDEPLLRELDAVSQKTKGEVRALFRAIVMSDLYLERPIATTNN